MLFSLVKDPIISANDLNQDLDKIYQSAHQWKMEFNPDPPKQATEVLFSCKKNNHGHPQLIFNGSVVVKVNEQKHLSLILESGLSLEKHLSVKNIKAKRNIGILKHLSKCLPLKTHLMKYKALVRSHLDHCDAIYHIPSILHQPPGPLIGESRKNSISSSSFNYWCLAMFKFQVFKFNVHDELGWETLSDRRKFRRPLQVHKIINNSTLSYLKDKLPPNCRVMFSGNIRTTFHEIICKSNRYMNSFFPDANAYWNIFMKIFQYKEVPSIGILQNDILSLIRPESKCFFKIHDTVGLRYLFQLKCV